MKKIYMMGAMLLMLLATSCHKESDSLMAYDYNENLVFGDVANSFAEKFKVMWHGMNQYYALWDLEEQQGLDWDKVYDEYLPQFEALDERAKGDKPVTDDELKEMLRKVLSPLHDGHFTMIWKNHITSNDVVYSPSTDRNASRDDAKIAEDFEPQLSYYTEPENGEIMVDPSGKAITLEYSTCWSDLLYTFRYTKGIGMKWIDAEIDRIALLTLPTEMEVITSHALKELQKELKQVFRMNNTKEAIKEFNYLVTKYAYLDIPGFDTIDNGFADDGISVKFALLKGNTGSIPYFYFSNFFLSPYLSKETANSTFDMNDKATENHVNKIKNVWESWFSYIQQLHKAGTLDGVIIDVRSNGGGMVVDGQYAVGALLPSGGYQYGYSRYKRGTSRYDYSPLMPAYLKTFEGEHEIIDDKPVVLLTNCKSMSMSEMTTQAVKLMPNGTIIGKRTYGGLCGLAPNEESTLNYAGYIGVEDVTPIFGYVPTQASFTMDKQQLEGYGITPDIEVAFDESQFDDNSHDSQLDRALQFIRTGK